MKTKSIFLTMSAALLLLSAMGCRKTPGTPSLKSNKTSVAVNEPLTITMDPVDNYTCIKWSVSNGSGSFTTINGGGEKDLTWSLSFAAKGAQTIDVTVKNCSSGCGGDCKETNAQLQVTVN